MSSERAANAWWGDTVLGVGQVGKWDIGPLSLWIERQPREWRVAWERTDDPLDLSLGFAALDQFEPPPGASVERVVADADGDAVRLSPGLADRHVVIRPESALYVSAGDAVALYVTTPVWVRATASDGRRLLVDIPAHRPTDTWFGTSTREGDLCYASRTRAKLELSAIQRRPARALTHVMLRNRSSQRLCFERLNLPAPHLALYAGDDGHLWTVSVEVDHDDEGLGTVRLLDTPPPEAGHTSRVSEPREPTRENIVVRALSAFL